MRSNRRQRSAWRIPPFVGLSVVGHALFIAYLTMSGVGKGCAPVLSDDKIGMDGLPGQEQAIDVTMIEPRELDPFAWSPSEAEKKAEELKKLEEAKKPEEDAKAEGQVVEVSKPSVEIRPSDDAKFLSEYDSKVEKEMKGPLGKEAAGAKEPQPTPPPTRLPQAVAAQPQQARPPTAGGAKGMGQLAMRSATEHGTGTGGKEAGEKKAGGDENGLENKAAEGSEAAKGQGGSSAPGGQPGEAGSLTPEGPGGPGATPLPRIDDLRPSEDALARAVGAGSSDYLKDIDDGEETLLNTKRWKYAGFFNRVKGAVRDNWHPDTAYSLRDPTGQIYGQKNRLTVLKVSLHPDGTLRDVLIEHPCGVDWLDDEAVSAFRAAQPFPNPPPGLVDADSQLITFRFGFYFEVSGPTKFRVFRSSN